jgi:hypothetical protein
MSAETTDRAAAVAILRKEFPEDQIGKLPKITCRDCSSVRGACGKNDHQLQWCEGCRNKITKAHTHIGYVGHAEVTNRLLESDPMWSWRPMAFDADGLPKFDGHGGLWIHLTVAGVERPGYGAADGKGGPNAIKEAIGDALRNAAMRFGVALDQWAKSDIHAPVLDDPEDIPATSEQINGVLIKLDTVRGIHDRESARQAMRILIGRPINGPSEMTSAEAELVLSRLAAEEGSRAPAPGGAETITSIMGRGQSAPAVKGAL